MLRRAIGAVVLTIAVGTVMTLVTIQLVQTTDTPTAANVRNITSLWQHGLLLICWTGLALMLLPWVAANAIIAYRWALALHGAAWRFQVWASWKVSEARNRAHAAEMWDNRPALTPDEQADVEARKRVLDLLYDSMRVLGEDADYIPSDDVLDRAFHAGRARNPWGSGTRAKALAPIRDYVMVVGQGGASQTVLKRGNLRVFAREVMLGSVKLVQTSAKTEEEDGLDGP